MSSIPTVPSVRLQPPVPVDFPPPESDIDRVHFYSAPPGAQGSVSVTIGGHGIVSVDFSEIMVQGILAGKGCCTNCQQKLSSDPRAEFHAFPSQEDFEKDHSLRDLFKEMPNTTPTIKLFIGNLHPWMTAARLVHIINQIFEDKVIAYAAMQYANNQKPGKTAWITVETDRANEVIEALSKRIMFSVNGYWILRNISKQESLAIIASVYSHSNAVAELTNQQLPTSPMWVELARTTAPAPKAFFTC